jgi:hypothetical protein
MELAVELGGRFGFLPRRRPGGPLATGKCSPDVTRRREGLGRDGSAR